RGAYNPDSVIADSLTRKGDLVAQALLSDMESQAPYKRVQAMSVLARMARPEATTTALVKDRIQTSLLANADKGNAEEIRLVAIDSLGYFASDEIRLGRRNEASKAVAALSGFQHSTEIPLRAEAKESLVRICD